jgi:MFS family permease
MRRLLGFGLDRDNRMLFYSQALMQLGFALQLVLWPIYIAALGGSPVQIGLVIGGAAILRTILIIPAGMIADRVSNRTMIIVTTGITIPGAVVMALAGVWWHALIGALLLEAAGLGIPAMSSYIASATTSARRTGAYTMVYSVAAGIGTLIGPPLGGIAAGMVALRAPFVASIAVFAVATALTLALRRNPRPDGDPPAEEAETAVALGYRDLLRMPAVVSVSVLHALAPLALSIGTVLLPLFLESVRDVSVSRIGVLGALSAAGGLLLGLYAGRSRTLGRPFAGMMITVGLVMASLALIRLFDVFAIIAVAFVMRGAYNVVWAMMTAALSEVTPEGGRGRAFGLAEFCAGIGDTAAPLMAGWLYATRETLPLEVSVLACVPLLGAVLLSGWLARRAGYGAAGAPAKPTAGKT